MSLASEFKQFIMRGNVMDLAVGVIIGASFGTIVASLTDDVIMPIIGAFFGGVDFSNYYIPLTGSVTATSLAAAREQGAVLAYGNFVTQVINFVILGFVIFMMVKAVNRLMRREAPNEPPPGPTADQKLLTEIRDILATRPGM